MAQISSLKTETKFKKTEIGEIPVDWEVVELGSLAAQKKNAFVDGPFGSNLKLTDYTDYGVPVLQGKNITNNRLEWSDIRYISENKAKELSRSFVRLGDMLMTKIGTVGCSAIVDDLHGHEEALIPANLMKMSLNEKKVYVKYLYQYLVWSRTRQRIIDIASQTAQPALNLKTMKLFKIFLPPLAEQKKIAEILSTVDEAIEKKKEVIEKTKELKKGLMQELLTRGIGHKRFKKTNIGQIPEGWEVMRVKDVCKKPQYGFTASATNESVGPKFLRITDIQDRNVNWKNVPYCKCPDSLIENYLLKDGDILFARTGATTGKSFIIKNCPKAIFAFYLIRIIADERIIPDFLYQVFNSFIYWKQINQQIGGSAQGGVNATSLSLIRIPLPSFAEQKKIAKILHEMDKQINSEIDLLKELLRIKNGLINELLQGKIRVKIER